MRNILAALIALSVFAFPRSVRAQEDSAEDHGSRAVQKAARSTSDGHKKERKKTRKKTRFELGYHLGGFGGTYLEESAWGPLINAELSGDLKVAKHRLSLDLGYGFDPFSTKTFNFPEEDDAPTRSRLTQPIHELEATLRHRRAWKRWFSTELRARSDWWLPKQSADERRLVKVEPELRFGKKRGPYASVAGDGFYKVFPNYEVQNRRLDQRGIDGTLELGYDFAPFNRIAVGSELDYTEYLDARYEVLNDAGFLIRSPDSKRYFERSPFIYGAIRPVKPFRANLRYSYELNDSIHYDRRMTGRVDGEIVAKFIRDYYDYRRHRVKLNTLTLPLRRFSIGTMSELWFRDFDTYEARDGDNNWTGDKRHDFSLELGLEAAYRVYDFEAAGADHGLFVSAFGSQLHRRSNMQREVSIATNFDVTRIFLGLELRSL